MKQKIIIFCLLIIATHGCNNNPGHEAKTGEGMITYKVSYPDSSKFGMKYMFFPKEIILVFKDDKATFIATAGLGMLQLVNLLDHKNKKYTSLLIGGLGENYGCTLTPDEVKQNESNPQYDYELKDETKTIAGLECKKAIVKDISDKTSFEVYYDDRIKFYYSSSPFKDFNYLFTEYTHTINNLTMKLTATKIDLTTPVDTSLFSIKGNYHWVNQKEFYNHLGQL